MTRIGSLLARAIVLALLLLTISGGVASAGGPSAGGPIAGSGGMVGTAALPDDPGYDLAP